MAVVLEDHHGHATREDDAPEENHVPGAPIAVTQAVTGNTTAVLFDRDRPLWYISGRFRHPLGSAKIPRKPSIPSVFRGPHGGRKSLSRPVQSTALPSLRG